MWGSPRPAWTRRLDTPTSGRPSARRSGGTSWSSRCWPTWSPASRPGGCSCGARASSRPTASATRGRRRSRSGTRPTTLCRARSMRSRATARTATRTSSRSSAIYGTRRRPLSTRARASCIRSSRRTTPSATARIGPCAASPFRPRATSACRRPRPWPPDAPSRLRDARQRGSTRPRAGTADMSALTAPEQATLRLLAATFVPAADADRVATIAADALDRAVDPAQLRQLRLVLRLLELPITNLATGAGFVAFRDMPPVARERTLLRWSASPLVLRRSGVNAFRKLLTFIAYADPGPPDAPNPLPRAIGYVTDDPPVPKERATIRPLVVDRAPSARLSGADEPIELEADVVVVGSGAGGGVVAAELARAGRSVLVVEAGPFVDEATMPRDELDAYGRLYLNHGLLSTWDGAVTMLAGSGVGGGTLVNWMTCLDAPADVRGEWAREHGLDGVDGDEWSADVREIEARLGVAAATVIPPKDELIRRGAAALGWDAGVIRRNATDCGDCGSCPFGCRRGTKQSGIRAHLADAATLGARVLDRARVRSIIRSGGGSGPVIGVAGTLAPDGSSTAGPEAPSRWFSVYAHQVVLAAGGLRSPAVLQASGIAHPSVGRHLRIHPVSIVGALHDEPVDMWRGTMQAARSLEFASDEPGRRRRSEEHTSELQSRE